jgi:hypothetical protein
LNGSKRKLTVRLSRRFTTSDRSCLMSRKTIATKRQVSSRGQRTARRGESIMVNHRRTGIYKQVSCDQNCRRLAALLHTSKCWNFVNARPNKTLNVWRKVDLPRIGSHGSHFQADWYIRASELRPKLPGDMSSDFSVRRHSIAF